MNRYRRLVHYLLQQRRTLAAILALSVLGSAVTVVQPWPMKILVDYALGTLVPPRGLESFLGALGLTSTPTVLVFTAGIATLGLFALQNGINTGLTWSWAVAGQKMVYNLAGDLFDRFQRLSLLFHYRRSVGDALNRLTGDAYCVYNATEDLLITPTRHIVTLGAVAAVAWKLDSGLTLLSLAVAPIMAGSALFFGPRLNRWTRLTSEAQSRVMAFVHQTLTAIPIVQVFGRENTNTEQYGLLASDAVSYAKSSKLTQGLYTLANGLVAALGTAIVLFIGGQRVLADQLTLGSLLVFLAYLGTLNTSIKGLMAIYGSLRSVEARIDRVMEVMEASEEVPESSEPKPLPERRYRTGRLIQLEQVTFGYEADRPVLDSLSIDAKPGETIALVGRTGAGKSTAISMVPRFFDPWSGRVLIDGIDVRDVQLSRLRSEVGLMHQEPFLFPVTVAENIAYGRPDAKVDEVRRAAVKANAEEFILGLPDGYDTVIGERGATLSGGQKQRLAIARVLLKNAPILILDEPTSALDAETENQLLAALERLIEGRTVLIVAHRLSTIRNANRIFVLEHGRVVESGSHRELLTAKGAYYKLHSLQTAGQEVSP